MGRTIYNFTREKMSRKKLASPRPMRPTSIRAEIPRPTADTPKLGT